MKKIILVCMSSLLWCSDNIQNVLPGTSNKKQLELTPDSLSSNSNLGALQIGVAKLIQQQPKQSNIENATRCCSALSYCCCSKACIKENSRPVCYFFGCIEGLIYCSFCCPCSCTLLTCGNERQKKEEELFLNDLCQGKKCCSSLHPDN